ncbi:MAG: hypothetical protein EPO02_02595, partial [Nitrospirae bacterium]
MLAAAIAAAAGCAHEQHQPFHRNGEPAITGNPATDPTLPPRLGHHGRLLLHCAAPTDRKDAAWDLYASAQDFDEGRQTFFLKRTGQTGSETLYPLHGHFLEGGASGIFMVHDGKGVGQTQGNAFFIDQSVNMGVLFFRTTGDELRAILDVFAEEKIGEAAGAPGAALAERSCRWGAGVRRLPPRAEHVRVQPN